MRIKTLDELWEYYVDNLTFSYSNLTSFENCKYCWFTKYALRQYTYEPNAFSEYGTVMHEVLENLETGEKTKADSVEYVKEKMLDIELPVYPNNDLNISYQRQAIDCIEKYDPVLKPIGIEEKVSFKLDDKYNFTGYIDKIGQDKEGNLYVIDHKSKGKFKSKEELKKYARQLYLYSIYVTKKYGREPKALLFHLFRRQDVVAVEYTKEGLIEAYEWALNIIDEIKNTRFFDVTDNEYWKENFCDNRNEFEHINNMTIDLNDYKMITKWVES